MDADARPLSLEIDKTSRRAVLTAVAWTAPVVLAASAVPAWAASCKTPGVLTSASWSVTSGGLVAASNIVGSSGWTGSTSALFTGISGTRTATGLAPGSTAGTNLTSSAAAGFLAERDATFRNTTVQVNYVFSVVNGAKYTLVTRVRSNNENAGIQLLDIDALGVTGSPLAIARYGSVQTSTSLPSGYSRVSGGDASLTPQVTAASTSITVRFIFRFPKTGVTVSTPDGDFWIAQPTLLCA